MIATENVSMNINSIVGMNGDCFVSMQSLHPFSRRKDAVSFFFYKVVCESVANLMDTIEIYDFS